MFFVPQVNALTTITQKDQSVTQGTNSNKLSSRMADIFSTVQFTIELLYPLIKDEVSLLYYLRDQVTGIRDELSSMLALLSDAEERAEDNNSVKEWVKQVRTLAYEIEDVIDEYKLFQKENRFGRIKQYMSLNVRSIATTIESLHKKAIETGRRKHSYFNSYRLNSGGSCGSCGGSCGGSSSSATSVIVEQDQHDSIRIQESDIVGAETGRIDIIELLGLQELDDSRLYSPVIAVIGMRGVGKTTVVGSVYHAAVVKDYFPIRAWVPVSGSYNHVDILRNMIKQFYEAANELELLHNKMSASRINEYRSDQSTKETYTDIYRIDSMDEISLQNLVRSYLKEKRYHISILNFF